jgi:hypothetical protein
MANCHDSFLEFLKDINLSDTQSKRLQTARGALTDKIKAFFDAKGLLQPEFQSQGSYALDTLNQPLSEDFDLDLGVYLKHLQESETISVNDAFNLIRDAVKGHTSEPLPPKDACVRVQYKRAGDTPTHHIDLAIHRLFTGGKREYGHLKDGWRLSDQKGFIEHFKERQTDQIRALVRLFKGWADYQKSDTKPKLPSGFHFTVCVLGCSVASTGRHDKSFVETAASTKARLQAYRQGTGKPIQRPVAPNEDIFGKFDVGRLDHLISKLDALIVEGRDALAEPDAEKAKRIWSSIFGPRLRAPEPEKKSRPEQPWQAPAIIGVHDKAA